MLRQGEHQNIRSSYLSQYTDVVQKLLAKPETQFGGLYVGGFTSVGNV